MSGGVIPQQPVLSRESLGGTLVLGHSDIETNSLDVISILRHSSFKKVYATNLVANTWLTKITGFQIFPLGLTNPTTETTLHPIFGDYSMLREAFDPSQVWTQRENLVPYANFTEKNGRKWRAGAMRIAQESTNIEVGVFEPSVAGRQAYLQDVQRHGLILCPRGNGHDTHRFYEALYMGALPVVLKRSYSARVAAKFGLPALKLNHWGQLRDSNYIKKRTDALRESVWDLSALRGSFWIETVLRGE